MGRGACKASTGNAWLEAAGKGKVAKAEKRKRGTKRR